MIEGSLNTSSNSIFQIGPNEIVDLEFFQIRIESSKIFKNKNMIRYFVLF